MAFKFSTSKRANISMKSKQPSGQQTNSQPFGQNVQASNENTVIPKLTNSQLNKLTRLYPTWLRDNSSLKQLPGIYQGVLGQVQLQPNMIGPDGGVQSISACTIVNKHQQQLDYMNRFTDTERVHQLLSASQLSNETLAMIWAHVNKTFPGQLTNREVCLALALIAIFQKLEKDGPLPAGALQKDKDPFNLVRAEKKPPVPILHPNNRSGNNNANSNNIDQEFALKIKKNLDGTLKNQNIELTPNDNLLVDLCEPCGESSTNILVSFESRKTNGLDETTSYNSICLIDSKGDGFEVEFFKLKQTWLQFLTSMRTIFKTSFDILNVENSRQSAIEALKSPQGQQFCKQLSLCYPLAHNIKYKIDELNSLQLSETKLNHKSHNEKQNFSLFDKKYITQIDDLMISINEYWAVLINLFHESGLTKFIELIMDGLNYETQTVFSRTLDELANEFDSSGQLSLCSICHTKFYLKNSPQDPIDKGLPKEDAELLIDDSEDLISLDNEYYYHAKCANFWLNQVESNRLPFHKQKTEDADILSPASSTIK